MNSYRLLLRRWFALIWPFNDRITSLFKAMGIGLCVLLTLARCAGSDLPTMRAQDRAISEANVAAGTAFEHGMIEEAIVLYRQALERAWVTDQPLAIGNAAYNLAACQLTLGQYEQARIHILEAQRELNRAGADLSDALLLEAKAEFLAGHADQSSAILKQILSDPRSEPTQQHLVQVAVLEGRLACDRNDQVTAAAALDHARQTLGSSTDNLLKAQIADLAARDAELRQDQAGVAAQSDDQATHLGLAAQYRGMGTALARAGQAYLALGHADLAADRFYRAARCAAGVHDDLHLLQWANQAIAAATSSGDMVTRQLAEALLTNLPAQSH